MKPLVVLDFDGTFTDAEQEGARFPDAYLRAFSELLGVDVAARWQKTLTEVLADREAGWRVGGEVVAPANCDPYIRSTCVAWKLCDQLGRLPDESLRSDVLSALYRFAYRTTTTAFRPEAAAVLSKLGTLGADVRVVTNSDPDVVSAKLKSLGVTLPVQGNAKKYVVDDAALKSEPQFQALADVRGTNLSRPLKVRRPYYFKLLAELWRETSATPAKTLVCGDIFELDLLLPLALGTHGHLLRRDNTLDYELAALQSFGSRATVSPSLEGLIGRVEALARA